MKSSTGTRLCNLLALAAIACGVGGPGPALATNAPASEPAASDAAVAGKRVSVTYANPEEFSEVRQFGHQDRFTGTEYLEPLKAHLIMRATRMLPPGDRLEVTITDIKLAGGFEPWHGPNLMYVRIMKDIYPPLIDLTFRWIDSNGKVLREGSRKLRNLGYLQSGVAQPSDSDPLRYDKALIDTWLRRGLEDL